MDARPPRKIKRMACMMPRAACSFQVDLFGEPAPVMAAPVGKRRDRARSTEAELEEYREQVAAALADLRNSVEEAVEDLRSALAAVEIVDGGGEVDCAIEALDEALTDALNAARSDLGAW